MAQYTFIWDMDGTLVDSYPYIVPAAMELCSAIGVEYSREFVRDYVIRFSVGKLLEETAKKTGFHLDNLKEQYEVLNDRYIEGIQAMPHAKEALDQLTKAGHACFVYTHRGASCLSILRDTGLLSYFTEVVTSGAGFPRKPAPDAILYLMEKYSLDPESSFYVGDRPIDILAGQNAGIGTILYLPDQSPVCPDGTETLVVRDLLEIAKVYYSERQK